jgi:uncharacterized protein YndB with AHSA1/START domain
MEYKTRIHAEDSKQDLVITREFDLPVELLFKAHAQADILEQWMSHEYGTTKVLKLEAKKHGSWKFQTTDSKGNLLFGASGVFHEFILNQKIIRTFEAENSTFDVQLDFIDFERLTNDTSKLTMHSVYRSAAIRDQLLKLPFEYGLNMAHNRLQNIVGKLNR